MDQRTDIVVLAEYANAHTLPRHLLAQGVHGLKQRGRRDKCQRSGRAPACPAHKLVTQAANRDHPINEEHKSLAGLQRRGEGASDAVKRAS